MAGLVFLGDDVMAAGYRLAGFTVATPAASEAAAAFARAREGAELIVITASVAGAIPAASLREAEAAPTPLVTIVPDLDEAAPTPDMEARIRAVLGLDA